MRALLAISIAVIVMTAHAQAGVSYQYDTLGRLSTATYDNGKQITYNYDPAGNRSSVVTQATPPHAPLAPKTKTAKRHRR